MAPTRPSNTNPPWTTFSSCSRRFRRSKKFAEAVEFVARFREYSPFNNMLVFMQNPLTTYFATARHWRKAFGRSIKQEARGMLILAPRTPVLMVYDIADTEGPPLPEKLRVFGQTTGPFNPALLDRTVKNCERDRIQVGRVPMGPLQRRLRHRAARRSRAGKCASACAPTWTRPPPTRRFATNWPTSIWATSAPTATAGGPFA